ncbi:MAG: 4'-phosphopantetheinyl transferase family protein [Coriobacteriia bacterium]
MTRTLPPDTIHVWIAFPEAIADPSLLERYRELLTADERERQQRYRFAADRHEALVTRALVRTVLSSYADVPPEEWRFETGDDGKPEIALPHISLNFNLSHTYGMIVCAVTEGRSIGIDVEHIDRETRIEELARRKFAPSEAEELLGLPEGARRSRFFDYWTLKESYVKAHGCGLAIPLDEFSFRIHDEAMASRINRKIDLSFTPGSDGNPAEWSHALIHPNATHRMAITWRGRDTHHVRIEFFQCVPLLWQKPVELPVELPPLPEAKRY